MYFTFRLSIGESDRRKKNERGRNHYSFFVTVTSFSLLSSWRKSGKIHRKQTRYLMIWREEKCWSMEIRFENEELKLQCAVFLCFYLFNTSCACVYHRKKANRMRINLRIQKKERKKNWKKHKRKKRETFGVMLNVRWNLSSVHWVRN